jgi:hypothetical protein
VVMELRVRRRNGELLRGENVVGRILGGSPVRRPSQAIRCHGVSVADKWGVFDAPGLGCQGAGSGLGGPRDAPGGGLQSASLSRGAGDRLAARNSRSKSPVGVAGGASLAPG